KTIAELRMGMVLVDQKHDNPGILIPVHRKLYGLLTAGKLKESANILLQHLDDSESRLARVMDNHRLAQPAGVLASKSKIGETKNLVPSSRRRRRSWSRTAIY